MEPNAAVRSRLTHSLEVSQVGSYLAQEIGRELVERGELDEAELGAMVKFVETACLMHDIGNPPFGHFGEAAIKEWFKQRGLECLNASLKAGNCSGVELNEEQGKRSTNHRLSAAKWYG